MHKSKAPKIGENFAVEIAVEHPSRASIDRALIDYSLVDYSRLIWTSFFGSLDVQWVFEIFSLFDALSGGQSLNCKLQFVITLLKR